MNSADRLDCGFGFVKQVDRTENEVEMLEIDQISSRREFRKQETTISYYEKQGYLNSKKNETHANRYNEALRLLSIDAQLQKLTAKDSLFKRISSQSQLVELDNNGAYVYLSYFDQLLTSLGKKIKKLNSPYTQGILNKLIELNQSKDSASYEQKLNELKSSIPESESITDFSIDVMKLVAIFNFPTVYSWIFYSLLRLSLPITFPIISGICMVGLTAYVIPKYFNEIKPKSKFTEKATSLCRILENNEVKKFFNDPEIQDDDFNLITSASFP